MAQAKGVLADAQRALRVAERAGVVASYAPDLREVSQRQRDLAMRRAQAPLERGERFAQQRLCLVEPPVRGHDRAEHAAVGGDAQRRRR